MELSSIADPCHLSPEMKHIIPTMSELPKTKIKSMQFWCSFNIHILLTGTHLHFLKFFVGLQKEVRTQQYLVCIVSSGTNSSRCCVLGRHILQRPRHLAASNQQQQQNWPHKMGTCIFLNKYYTCYYCDLFGGDSYIEKKTVVFFFQCLSLVDWDG